MSRLKRLMRRPVLVDLRNVYAAEEVIKAGFAYTSIGRASGAAGRPLRKPGLGRTLTAAAHRVPEKAAAQPAPTA